MSRAVVQVHRRPGRRLGLGPGRRLAWALALSLAAVGVGVPGAAVADPGQIVVQATVYPHSGGGVSSQSVTLATLEACPPYSGSTPMYLHPGDQPYSPAAASAWSLGTVLSCGLRLPPGGVTDVQIDNPPHGFEVSLTNAQLSDPSQWHDPSAPDALPVISVDGTENQTTYTRPWLGGLDANASDQVVSDGSPIDMVVYENGPPLRVTASSQTISQSSSTMEVQLNASVVDPEGRPVAPSELSWSWNFGDGASSTEPGPHHSFAPGAYPVTVQVTDNANGTGGTDNITVTFSPTAASGSGSAGGAGRNPHSRSPTGPVNSKGNHPGTSAGKPASGTGGSGHARNTGAQDATSAAQAAPAHQVTTPTTGTPSSTAHKRSAPQHPATQTANSATSNRASKPVTRSPTSAPLVAGRLISDVTPVAADASPLVQRASAALGTAPAVGGLVSSSPLSAIGAGLGLALLFGLGAARELGGATVAAKLRRLI